MNLDRVKLMPVDTAILAPYTQNWHSVWEHCLTFSKVTMLRLTNLHKLNYMRQVQFFSFLYAHYLHTVNCTYRIVANSNARY